MVVVNKRDVSKEAMPQLNEKSAKWISKYGSVTFNQYGREFPTGGMNEKGLVIELMMLNDGEYPPRDRRPVVGCLEWIQYQLDNSQSIADVLTNARRVRISAATKLHYLVCEASGDCLTAEFINGKFVPHYGNSLPVAALTNDTYENSYRYAQSLAPFGGTAPVPDGSGSLDRFARAAIGVKNYRPSTNAVTYSFQLLDNVAQSSFTRWNIVYDIANLRVYFRTSTSRQIKQLSLRGLDFECSTPVRILNMSTNVHGDITRRLIPYSTQINRTLVQRAYDLTPSLTNIPVEKLEPAITHPDSFTCVGR